MNSSREFRDSMQMQDRFQSHQQFDSSITQFFTKSYWESIGIYSVERRRVRGDFPVPVVMTVLAH